MREDVDGQTTIWTDKRIEIGQSDCERGDPELSSINHH